MNALEHSMDTVSVGKTIRANLKARTGKMWSVTRGSGTSCGWIRIKAPVARVNEYASMTEEDRLELGKALGFAGPCHCQGVNIPASHDHYREYLQRSAGESPSKIAEAYWD